MARLVVGAVGAVIGFYVGGPVGALQGFTIAYGLSAGLDPNSKVLGPKLNDLKAPSASYGAPITYVEGAPRLAGNFIWASEKREIATTTSEGGKGGPGVDSTVFTYEIDCMILLAINECQAIRRIWSNGKLVWSNADDADGETLAASEATNSWRDLRFYDGNPDQLPDPTYEAAVGVGNAPAYRTRTTVAIDGLNLGGSGQLPILTFEVVSEAGEAFTAREVSAFDSAYGTMGSPAFSATAPFDTMVAGGDTNDFTGEIFSYDVYTIAIDGTASHTNHVAFGTRKNAGMFPGNTDESCFVVAAPGAPPFLYYEMFFADGTSIVLDTSANSVADMTYCKLGNDIVVGQKSNETDTKLRRYSRADGSLQATAAAGISQLQGVAIGGGYVWSLASSGLTVYKNDLTTLALVDVISIPAAYIATQGAIACDGDGVPNVLGTGNTAWQSPLIKWNGTTWDVVAYYQDTSGGPAHTLPPTPSMPLMFPDAVAGGRIGFDGDILFNQVFYDGGVGPDQVRIHNLLSTISIDYPTLDQVVRRLCLRTGLLTDDDIDVTDLSHDVAIADGLVRAMAISQVSSTRVTLEMLMQAYLFECVEGEKLVFVRRGGNSVATIPYQDLGASQDGKAEPLPLKRINDLEIAARVSVKYGNVANDFQDGLEAADRLVTESTSESLIELPLGFLPSEAKKLADANTLDLAVTLIQIGPIVLPRKYARLDATDVITLTGQDGSTFRARIVKGTIGAGLHAFELVLDDATVINSAAETDDDYVSSSLVRLPSETDMEELDIPILRDEDDALGPYLAVFAGERWGGAKAYKSPDDTTYTEVATFTSKTAVGTASTTLGDFTGTGFDEVNTVTVSVGDSTLSSFTRDDVLNQTCDAYLIGSEILYAYTATLTGSSPNVYVLSGLLRGLRGTEQSISTHGVAEVVVQLQASGSGLRKITDTLPDVNVPRYYKGVTIGRSAASVGGEAFTDTGIAKKPFAVADMRVDYTDPLNPVLNWHRRSRLSSSLFGLPPPLGEASEAYAVEVYDSGDVLLDSATVSTASYTLSPPSAGDYVTVWQIGSIGRGYPSTLEF